ncbi:MAG: UDP-N-acetylglucosamine 1-carboxyvinyltransferase [Candidatus Sungbacteria bacterium]|nr:UDP-N-acetylglucosamine 1-carboxyvinyltransferase [Candidatus Sungbacteria bacterium]
MEHQFVIRGGRMLEGEIEVRGSKNSAPKLMIASLLTEEPCTFENIPFSQEIDITKELCEIIGSAVLITPDHRSTMETRDIKTSRVSAFTRKNRIPILALGPLLHRNGIAEIPVLGGCPIGHRPINFHIEALNRMGVRIERREQSYYAETDGIHGADIEFATPSVGATENVLLAAVRAKGKTIISNAAVEPEIMNLVDMLQRMGSDIHCDLENRKIIIEGVEKLHGTSIRVMPDRSEIVSFATAALATEGDIFIRNIEVNYMQSFLELVRAAGGNFELSGDGIRFYGKKPYRAVVVETAPHPGFMTDWQQPFCVLLTQAEGESIIHETVYEDRLGYTKDLGRMGATIEVSDECLGGSQCRFHGQTFNHSARIAGLTPLKAAKIAVADIRAGMANIIAALIADGESALANIGHIDRGYEKIDERLRHLGAEIERS